VNGRELSVHELPAAVLHDVAAVDDLQVERPLVGHAQNSIAVQDVVAEALGAGEQTGDVLELVHDDAVGYPPKSSPSMAERGSLALLRNTHQSTSHYTSDDTLPPTAPVRRSASRRTAPAIADGRPS